MKALFDSNILIDYLNGEIQARDELEKHQIPLISIITWMEIMVGVDNAKDQQLIDIFFRRFRIINIDQEISEIAVNLRKKHKIKLPDAIVWASAKAHGAILITRNTKDFSENEVDIHCPYRLEKTK